jgi:hypothetical protein
LQKPEGFRVKASEDEVVVLYFEPSATQNLKSSGFPEGEQHGKIDPIPRIHQLRHPRNGHLAIILTMIAEHYLIFGMLFMQLRGLVPDPLSFVLISTVNYANNLILDAGHSIDNYFFLSSIAYP